MSNDTRPHLFTQGQGLQGDPGGDWSATEDAVHHVVGQPAGSVGSANYSAAGVYIHKYDLDGDVVATNSVLNPSPQVNLAGWTYGGSFSASRTAGEGVDGGYGWRALSTAKQTVDTAGPQSGIVSASTEIPVTPGSTVYPSIHVKNVGWQDHSVRLWVAVRNSVGGTPAGWTDTFSTTSYTVPADNSYVRVLGDPVLIPAGAARMAIRAVNTDYATNPWLGPLTNRIGNPDTVSGGTGFSPYGASGSYVGGKYRLTGTTAVNSDVWPMPPSGEDVAGRFTASVGSEFAWRVEVSNPDATPIYVATESRWYDNTGIGIGSYVRSGWVLVAPGVTVTLEALGTVPSIAGLVGMLPALVFASTSGGATVPIGRLIDTTRWALYTGSSAPIASPLPYFSGSTLVSGRTTAWTGTVNQTTSTATGDVVTVDRSSNAMGDYFDGETVNTTGISYRWSGTPYASTSEKVELYELTTPVTSFSKYLINNPAVFSHQENDGTPDLGKIAGRITSVSPSGASVDITQTTYLQRFVAERAIPAVSSGTALGSIDLALQMVSPTWACTLPAEGVFWTLLGHDAGFDSTNTLTTGEDEGIPVAINDTVSLLNYIEYWPRVVDNANVRVWSDPWGDGAAEATQVLGSSPYPVVGEAHLAMWVTDLETTGSSSVFVNAGPENLGLGTGMNASVAVNGTSDTISINGTYNPGGTPTPFSVSASIAALDTSLPLQVAVAYGWTDSTHWRIRAWVVNGDGFTTSGTPVVVTTGSLNSNLDKYAEPLSFSGTGPMRYLYQERLSSDILTDTTVASNYLVDYVDPDTVFEYEYDANGDYDLGYEPIANYQGNVWDYLCAVLSLFRRGLRVDHADGLGLVCELNQTADDVIEFNDAENQPTLQVSTDGIGRSIDYALYSTDNIVDDVIYDAFLTGEIWSVDAGETKDIRIATEYTVTMAKNPRPAYYNVDYESFSTVYGSYIVSGSDNLPVQDFEWVSYGGQVLVTEVGVGYINLRLVGPPGGIPGVPGPYSLSISDGSTSYPRLTLLGSGVRASKQTVRRGTGADPQITAVELATTIDNPAISSYARLYTAHYRASKIASGPRVQLTATLPRQAFETQKFGLFQGSTFVYEDTRWRIIGGSVTELGYSFTAMPVTDMADLAAKWSGYTQGDFETYWDGWQMKDFQLSPLR